MKKNIIFSIISFLLITIIIILSFFSGLIVGKASSTIEGSNLSPLLNVITSPLLDSNGFINKIIQPYINLSSLPQEGGTPNTLQKLFIPFWESWKIVHDQYIDQPVDDKKLMQGAIRGMLDSLGDPHTSYMDPEQYQAINQEMEGEYEGIGAWVDPTAEYLTIISPMPGSPAEKAGLQPEDQIIAINGEDMTGIDGEIVRKKVIGPANTKVTLTIRRKGVEKPFDVEIIRAKVTVPSVKTSMLEDDIAYVQLFIFGENTSKELRQQLKEILNKKPKGLILDLRYNGGGFLNTAIDVASEFIKDGIILYEDYGNRKQIFKSNGRGLATDIPLVVLINEGSASASEIVAGAIQDHQRGELIGVRSFGKGSVQNWIPLSYNGGAVRVTIARWLTPNQKQINKKGLTPDYEVSISDEDYKNKKDPQLDKAVEVLKEKIDKNKK